MNLDELQSVRDRERQTDKLQQLRASFYADAGEFIQGLRERRTEAADRADDPFDSPEVNRLTDEINTAEQTVEAIYEKRVGKIVKAASFAAADLPTESDGMTAEEQDLFETLVADIKDNRQHVQDVLGGESPAETVTADDPEAETDVPTADVMGDSAPTNGASPGPTSREQTDPDLPARDSSERSDAVEGDGPADASSGESDSPDRRQPGRTGGSGERLDRETVRITDDVGAIFGVDEREYDLTEDDVVTLPSENAGPLVERGAAERID